MKSLHFVCIFSVLISSFVAGQTSPVPLANQPLPKKKIAPADRSQPDPKAQRAVAESYGKLPLSFEANQGQKDARVKFLSHGSGYTLFLTSDEAVFMLTGRNRKAGVPARKASRIRTGEPTIESAVLRMRMVGANPAAKVAGEDGLPGKINYFIGNDPKKWRNNVPTHAKVRYHGVYPGIDLIYYGNQRKLEYDLVVTPGTDLRQIQFDVRGAKHIGRDEQGNLLLYLGQGSVRWNRPIVYQEIDGKRKMIDCRYVIRRGHRVGFAVASYDLRRPLIIDPAIVYSTYLGGTPDNYGNAIAIDASGNAYVAGYTNSSDFPTTSGAFQASCEATDTCAFVTEFNPSGSALVYSTYLGGNVSGYSGAVASAVAVDGSGDAYVTGQAGSAFPTTLGAFQTSCTLTNSCAFVTKLNPTGSALLYSTYLAGDNVNYGYGIAVNASGNAYVAGYTTSAVFPTTLGAFQTTCPAGCPYGEGFVTEFNASGSALIYSTYLGGSSGNRLGDIAFAIAVDGSGDAYVTGQTDSSDFPTTPGAFQTSLNGPEDAFVTEFDPSGAGLIYSTYLGGSGVDAGAGIALNAAGNAYVTGLTGSSDFPTTPGAFQTHCALTNCSNGEAFVTEFDPSGSGLVYSTYLGGSGNPDFVGDSGSAIVVDGSGDAYATGNTSSLDFPITPGAFEASCPEPPFPCAFVSELNPSGSALVYSTYLGAPGDPQGPGSVGSKAIALDGAGNFYVAGGASQGFQTTPGAFQTNFTGNFGAFVTKFVPGDQVWPLLLSFGNQMAGSASQPQIATLTNSDTDALTITSIGFTGANSSDFGQTNNCGISLAAGSSCNINVTFDPTGVGTRSATLNISDSAANTPQTVVLSGTGTAPLTLSPSSLNFGNQSVGATSSPQITSLTNIGSVSLAIASIVITGANSNEFAQTNNCPSSLAPNGSCQISVTFTPTAPGNATASVIITNSGPGSPENVPLSGNGEGALVTLSPPQVNFPDQYVGTSGLPQTVTVTNTGNATLTVANVTTSPSDFAPLSTCGSSLAAGASCGIGVFFDPTTSGTRNGVLTVTDNASNSPQTAPLTGVGQDFSMAPSGSSTATVSPGQTANYTIVVTPGGGFDQTVTLTCSGAPAGSMCSVSPSSVTLNGSKPASVTVSVNTAGTAASLKHSQGFPSNGRRLALWLAVPGLFGLVLLGAPSKRKRAGARVSSLAILCILSLVMTWSACGGGNGSGTTPAGSYSVTVTGTFTSGATVLAHNTRLALVVQ